MNDDVNIQNFDMADTTPDMSKEQEYDEGDKESTVEAQGEIEPESENEELPFISVQYNHKTRNFTKDEAIKHIQKGMHTENLRAKLEYIAKQQGKSVNSLVDDILLKDEQEHRRYLESIYGDDLSTVETGMEIYRDKQSKEYRGLIEEGKRQNKFENLNSMLADQYMDLKREMPNAPEYSDLPDSVIVAAAEGKRDLLSAYLHYLYKEKIKIEAAHKTQEAAKNASSGKMNVAGDDMTSSDRSFLAGLWSK